MEIETYLYEKQLTPPPPSEDVWEQLGDFEPVIGDREVMESGV
jgi:hypothetical protein